MFRNAKTGDKVYDIRRGYGVIVNIQEYDMYPITAQIGNLIEEYTLEGKSHISNEIPFLYWDKPEIIAPPKPLPDLKVDTKVLVWNDNGNIKYKRHFSHFDENGKIYCFLQGTSSFTANNARFYMSWDNCEVVEND